MSDDDSSLTNRDFFVKENDLTKPDTSERQWGGTIGGPIAKDKMHFFFSLERVSVDRSNTINILSHPEFDASPTTKDRVWSTFIRGDHQINANNQHNVHWLREQSPQLNQIIGRVTQKASREESDVDQNLVANFNSVRGNTKLNTLRFGFTRENVAFADPCFNGNGRRQDRCQPTLAFLTFTDQQSTTASARINNAYQLDDTFSWFVPGKARDHDIKFGVQYQQLTLSLGARYDIEDIPFSEPDNPFFQISNRPIDTNNIQPRVGVTYALDDQGQSVLRGGYGLFYDKTHFEEITALLTSGVLSDSFLGQFPANRADPGPSNGQLPTDPFLVNGPTVNRDLLNAMFPPGSKVKNTGTVFVDNPDRRLPDTQEFTVGYERQLGPGLSAGADYVHSRDRSLFMSRDLNLDVPQNQGPTDFFRRHNLVVSGAAVLPRTGGVTVSWVARYLSGEPFTITNSSTDPDRNGVLFDPLPSGDYSGNGPDAITVHSNGRRNGATGPNFFQLDTRFGYKLRPVRGRTLDIFVELFNLTGRANFDTPAGDRRSTNFLVLTDLREGAVPRTAQIGIRPGF